MTARSVDGEKSRPLETGFAGLDLIRFAAAMMVAFYHFTYVGLLQLGEPGEALAAAFAPARPLTSSLWVAVQIFFVLSGVVIAFSAQGRSAGEFIRRRAARLYPAALICATLTVIVWPKSDPVLRWLKSIALWPAGPWVSDVYWTMAVEIAFYVLVAAALAIGGSRWVSRLGYALVLASAAWWGLRILNLGAGDALRPLLDQVGIVDPILLFSHGCFFGLGMILFERHAQGPSVRLNLLAALATMTGLAAIISNALSLRSGVDPGIAGLIVPPLLWLLALAGMLVALALGPPTKPGRLPLVIRQAGLATYPLYLVHAEIGVTMMLVLEPIGPLAALVLATAAILGLVAMILVGEKRLRSLIGQATSGPAPGNYRGA